MTEIAKTRRKSLSKKTRFDVFKRDAFKCQYCGAHPPEAVLHVDHINPVALGGGNDIDNLVTSCVVCNLGKGARPLTVVSKSLAEKATDIAEREAQLLGYQAVLEAKRDRIEDELWRAAEVLHPGSSINGMSRQWTASIRKFNEALGVHAVMDAAAISAAKFFPGSKRSFLYFCGICWQLIRQKEVA